MPRKKWITKKEVSNILNSYSVRPNEFGQIGDNGYFVNYPLSKANGIAVALFQI